MAGGHYGQGHTGMTAGHPGGTGPAIGPPAPTPNRAMSPVIGVLTGLSAVTLPALALAAGWFASQYADPVRVGIAIPLGLALWAVSFFVVRWLSARARVGLAVILGVATMGAAMAATEYAVLISRSERVDAVVVSKRVNFSSGRGVSECEVVQEDGTPVRPDPDSGDCRYLDEGDRVTLLVDPKGQAGPVMVGRRSLGFNSSTLYRGALPGAAVLALAQAITIVLTVVRGRRRRDRPRGAAAVDRGPGPPPGGPPGAPGSPYPTPHTGSPGSSGGWPPPPTG